MVWPSRCFKLPFVTVFGTGLRQSSDLLLEGIGIAIFTL